MVCPAQTAEAAMSKVSSQGFTEEGLEGQRLQATGKISPLPGDEVYFCQNKYHRQCINNPSPLAEGPDTE